MPVACGARLRCSATRACSRAQLRERVVDFVSALALAVVALALAAVAVASASHRLRISARRSDLRCKADPPYPEPGGNPPAGGKSRPR